MQPFHHSVLSDEVINSLSIQPSDTVVDATIGGAGHFATIGNILDETGTLIGIDLDARAHQRARELLPTLRTQTILIKDNFRNLSTILDQHNITSIDKSLFDLGWSGFQLHEHRGFSFQETEPLYMTYEEDAPYTAAHIINSASEEELNDILHMYGEERFARSIARSIIEKRSSKKILTTTDLVDAVLEGTPRWYQQRKIHPATKTFQAFRIAINDEIDALRDGINAAIKRTRSGGIIAVITFHSIEDRVVKNIFRDAAYAGSGMLVTRKPITPSTQELNVNHRARSAKLRVFSVNSHNAVISQPTPQNNYA